MKVILLVGLLAMSAYAEVGVIHIVLIASPTVVGIRDIFMGWRWCCLDLRVVDFVNWGWELDGNAVGRISSDY